MIALSRTIIFALAAFVFGLWPLAHGAPRLDATFGIGGTVRVGAATGFEDKADVSAIQSDGKVIVAGTSRSRQTLASVTRFLTNGTRDSSFGVDGTLLLAPPGGGFWSSMVQIEIQADGSLFVVGVLSGSFVLAHINAGGSLDSSFGSGGMVLIQDNVVFRGGVNDGGIRLAVQSDGKLLTVGDASIGGTFQLRFRRFLPHGEVDTSFGSNGVRTLGDLPPEFGYFSTGLAIAEPGGGFTLAAVSLFDGGTYLLLRVTSDGNLDPTFGGVGYVSGFDVGNPHDVPVRLARTAGNRYALLGFPQSSDFSPAATAVVWEIDAHGVPVAAFGGNGRLLLASPNGSAGALLALADGGLATVQSFDTAKLRVSRFDANGNPVAQFGTAGSATITAGGYLALSPTGIHADADGRLTVAGWGYAHFVDIHSGYSTGADVVLASLTSDGAIRTDYGHGDGIAVWNNPGLSFDRVDALRFDTAGRIVLAGYTNATGIPDYLLSRFNPYGALDSNYGVAGRLYPQQSARFIGIARAAMQPDGAMVVVGAEAYGSNGTVRGVTAFRATADGALDHSFQPSLFPAGAYATVGLGIRPDGRLLYMTNDGAGFYELQQLLADGRPDPDFGTNGRVAFPVEMFGQLSIQADLVVSGDGAVVVAVFTYPGVHLYKFDAHGAPVQAFGTGGHLVHATDNSFFISSSPTLLALADGTLLAAGTTSTPAGSFPFESSVYLLRTTVNGQVISAGQQLAREAFVSGVLAALPDSSVLIARPTDFGGGYMSSAALYRLLPDGRFDAGFGAGGAFPLLNMTAVNAMALDPSGRLVVAGQDGTSAVLARFELDAPVSGIPVVEYYNVDLRHYFMTADAAEMASVESGGAGPGWQRTGNGLTAYVPQAGVPVGALPVCRFYGTPGIGPNSHFYTVDPVECAAVRQDRGWTFEGIAFYAFPPRQGHCAEVANMVYRAYNNRFAQNDSNHRYTTDPAIYQAMLGQGWVGEGVRFCAAP